MMLRRLSGALMPRCKQCSLEMERVTVLRHSDEYVLHCDRCNLAYAGHPIEEFLRRNPDALIAETYGELTRSTDAVPFRAMLNNLMLTPERFAEFIDREVEKRRGDPAPTNAGHGQPPR